MTTHSTEKFLNTPQRILSEIKDAQIIIKQQNELIYSLKDELDQHLQDGTIEKEYEDNGIKARRKERITYIYSEELEKFKEEQKSQLKQRQRREEFNEIAKKHLTSYWEVR